jgi:hypothetical protein
LVYIDIKLLIIKNKNCCGVCRSFEHRDKIAREVADFLRYQANPPPILGFLENLYLVAFLEGQVVLLNCNFENIKEELLFVLGNRI